jgi:hypothetical protein
MVKKRPYGTRTFSITYYGLIKMTGSRDTNVRVIRPDMSIEEVKLTTQDSTTGDALAVMTGCFCVGIEVPHYIGMKAEWGSDYLWHSSLLPGFTALDERYEDRSSHPNEIAFRKGTDIVSNGKGCANGRAIHWFDWSITHIDIKEDGVLIRPPEHKDCFKCMNDMHMHKEELKNKLLAKIAEKIDYNKKETERLQAALSYHKGELESAESELERTTKMALDMIWNDEHY